MAVNAWVSLSAPGPEAVLVTPLNLEGLLLVEPRRHGDGRGYFAETFRHDALAAAGFDSPFVQENTVRTDAALTLRGLHYQSPPAAQDKLVCVLVGAVLDVAVDIRRTSATYGQYLSVELTSDNGLQLLVPSGFAHGYVTLVPDCLVTYKVSKYYEPEHEAGLNAFDASLDINWGTEDQTSFIRNERDKNWGKFCEFVTPFI